MTVLFVTSLRHPDNSADYARVEQLLESTLRSLVQQDDEDFVVIVVGNRVPSFRLPEKVRFVCVDFPPPPAVNGPHASREPFVIDKGSKIGIGLLAARDLCPDWVMIFDADDYVHRGMTRWVHAHPGSPGWIVDRGWMYSRRRGAAREISRLYRTCGTCYVLPYSAYEVPADLSVSASQVEVVTAYGEILPNMLGAHRNAVAWHARRGRELETLPFPAAIYQVDTGENHSGKSFAGTAAPLNRAVAEEFGLPGPRTAPLDWWRSAGPRPMWENIQPRVQEAYGSARSFASRARRMLSRIASKGHRRLARRRVQARFRDSTALNDADRAMLRDLRERTHHILAQHIGRDVDVALLDVPNQRNTGDSLILAGELVYLRRLGARIRYMSDLAGFDADALRRRLPDGGVILMHGGGNFGDIWSGHQLHRERVASMFPHHRIVVLPQSVLFRSAERAAHADAVLSTHPDLTVLVRDEESRARFRDGLPNVRVALCPDAALGWSPRARGARQSGRRVLVLAREDREATSGLASVPMDWIPGVDVVRADWRPRGAAATRWRIARWITRHDEGRLVKKRRRCPSGLTSWAYRAITRANIESALTLFRGASVVVADRLHAHILAVLLGISNVVLDNSYGKLGAVLHDYTGAFTTVHVVDHVSDAQSVVEALLVNDHAPAVREGTTRSPT